MTAGPGHVAETAAADLPPETRDLEFDPQRAAARKRVRLIHLNTWTIPELRLVGFLLVALGALVHNAFILHDLSWIAWARLAAALAVYAAASWYLLYLFFADLLPYLDLGTVFLAGDMWMQSLVIYFTGAERSWMFFLPLFRVADQTTTSFRRAIAFAHLAPLAYAAVIAHAVLIQRRAVPLAPEAAKVLFIYIGSLYISLTARTGDVRHRRSAAVIRVARSLIRDLERNSGALEASSAQLHLAVEQQAQLADDNARLYANAEAREARLEQILQSTSDGIIFAAPGGRIETTNVRAGDLLGFDPEAVIGQEVSRILGRLYSVGDGDAFLVTLKRLLNDPGPGGSGDLQQPTTGRVFHWVARPTRDTAGGAVGLTFTFHDVTPTRDLVRQLEDKSRLLEEARRKAEDANRAKGEFLANVTHEIRTPLSAIVGVTQLLLDDGALPPSHADGLRRIKTSAESLLVIIADILDFSKIESRKMTLERTPMELRAALEDVVDTVRASAVRKALALVLEIASDVPDDLIGDALRLRQVLLNLLGNAIKFTERGEVRVRVGVASQLPAEVCLHFAIIDTGIGIPRDKRELVFEAFAQADASAARRYGGTGLGLSISARLVELMGGDIWVESEVGRGSAFRFTAQFGLPAASTVPAPSRPSGVLTVLVAEDEQVHRELLTRLLLARGHRVITAHNGREALVELARHPIQVVLLDLQMPEMDGYEMAIAVRDWERASGGHLPLIAMTASTMAHDAERSAAAGMDELLTKPIARERLYRAVESLARDRASAAAPPPELAGRAAFLEGLGNDVDLARKLVDIFLSDSDRLLSDISTAIANEDAETLRRATHTLRGSVGNFPAGGARDAASRMELIGFDADFEAARGVFPILEREVERLKSLLPALI
ncbi:MAG: hypothetical protein DMF86_10020 [Acidobacteria bacterium]|nr:MAG: hypothetical protein DMF86_10020 [Acidobacteriota bacterium]